ncbi:TadE family protein [Maritimibacter sp. UBA3975]|uniref:TadE/TadG family type IV pilus assembly protein n=1 Tax=Maritimibacter sp. UBA3975 TaxID=1946833 RepID=UPI000C09461B|nr:TadE family protein [Maritimibacter sp. UBA3975]MAM62282.1 hypothetical protein [Maritimibacter sp.]|tara:strand:- start:163 stop:657 length:495 start_codon:yes stop_codon:yes gene_type:complete
MRARSHIRRFARREDGAVLAEFGLVLPLMLVLFALSIEAARTFWAYQATIAGVRDATRYVTRAQDGAICDSASPDLDAWGPALTDMVRNAADGTPLFPSSITVSSVVASVACVAGDYRQSVVPVATVTAALEITYPFARVFRLTGLELPTANTVVRDSGRIFGT